MNASPKSRDGWIQNGEELRLWCRVAASIAAATVLWAVVAAMAVAGPVLQINSSSNTSVKPGETLEYAVGLGNVGDVDTDGSDVIIRATLPPGMTASGALVTLNNDQFPCFAGDGIGPVLGADEVICSVTKAIAALQNSAILKLRASVASNATGTLTSVFEAAGGGAAAVKLVDPVTVADAEPGFGVDALDVAAQDARGEPLTQAGGHPAEVRVAIDFNTHTDPLYGPAFPVEPVKDIVVDLPAGVIGDPSVVTQCAAAELANASSITAKPLCPVTSQVGVVFVRANKNGIIHSGLFGPIPIFNMVPPPGAPARLGFNALGSVVVLDAFIRTGGDYGLSARTRNTPEGLAAVGTTAIFWGVPSDPSHDGLRACPGSRNPYDGGPTCTSGAPREAFLRLPTSCPPPGTGDILTAHVASWSQPDRFVSFSAVTHLPPGFPFPPPQWGPATGSTGCAKVPFEPKIEGDPTSSSRVAQPTGFAFDVSVPQTSDPGRIAEGDLKRATVSLPQGLRVSPSSADGLQACSPEQIRLHDDTSPECPDAAKIGSVTVDTPLLPDPLTGAVYLASPHDNPFGTLLSLYIVANGSGVVVKLAGKVEADPVTGQLSSVFDDNPQTPFSNLHLQFDGGPRAPLALPRRCGEYTTHAQLESWSGKIVDTESTFTVSGDGHGAPCPAPQFAPDFLSETEMPVAGKASTFVTAISRDDDDEELGSVTVNMPDGLTGKIANVALCSEGDAKTGTCPESSRVGTVIAGAGAGPDPFFIKNGRAYLTGPYKGAPYGISVVVPAVAGPFDLGNVVTRLSIFVDKHTAELRIVSDPLPRILEGIPLDVRDVRVLVDRPDFTVNPTSCAEKAIRGVITSTEGKTANVSSRFQVGECRNLGFKPRMVLTVGGRGHTARNRTTPLSTTLTLPSKDQANLRAVRVTLPTAINARLTVINDACTRAEFEANLRNCDHARAGTAVAHTPLLRDPLRGSVYFVKNGKPLPDLFIALRGEVEFDLIGRVSIPGSTRLATTFDAIPDVPVRSFTLRLFGDSQNGSVGAATNLCSARARRAKAELDYTGQNGKTSHVEQALKVKGCGKNAAHHRHRRRGSR